MKALNGRLKTGMKEYPRLDAKDHPFCRKFELIGYKLNEETLSCDDNIITGIHSCLNVSHCNAKAISTNVGTRTVVPGDILEI